ncbi:proteasome subunit alpha type-3-like [Mercenaria mercenaria]|uniref:proteasome subunit alpha type-3-like n=1 Tax=Mercenaria mercenaria TaxID=6596 RepID=UPI00234F6C38|nr:proteasome subunit alpha type-3-like [Mercenaria mercenaria]
MSSIGTGYDLSASQFSPDGRVFQVEYALKAVENSGTAIGIRGKDGIVFGVEKLVTSKLYETGANKRIFNIDRHIGMAVAGLLADARQIVETSREEAASYRSNYGSPIPLKLENELVTGGRHELVPKNVFTDAEKYAKESLEESDDSDDEDLYWIL